MMDEERYFTVEDLAKRFKVSRPTIYAWMASGALESIKLGRTRRFSSSAIARFVEQGKNQPVDREEVAHG